MKKTLFEKQNKKFQKFVAQSMNLRELARINGGENPPPPPPPPSGLILPGPR